MSSKQRATEAQVALRRDNVIQDLIQGVPRSVILERYGYKQPGHLSQDVKRALEERRKALALTVDEYREMQLETLNTLAKAAWRVLHKFHVKVANGEVLKVTNVVTEEEEILEDTLPCLAAIDRVLKIEQQRADLLGTRAPAQVDVGGTMRVVVTAVDLKELT